MENNRWLHKYAESCTVPSPMPRAMTEQKYLRTVQKTEQRTHMFRAVQEQKQARILELHERLSAARSKNSPLLRTPPVLPRTSSMS